VFQFILTFYRKYLLRNKLNILNIAGMAFGMFTFMFIYFYVYCESNYDQFFDNSKNIYHVSLNIHRNGEDLLYSNTPIRLAEEAKDEIPGIKSTALYSSVLETVIARIGEETFLKPEVFYVNSEFFDVFSYKSIEGNLSNALSGPGKAVLTQSAAQKYFGTSEALGKQMEILHSDKAPLLVTVCAIIEDLPANSNIHFEVACHKDDYIGLIGDFFDNWYFKISQSYIELYEHVEPDEVLGSLNKLIDKNMNDHSNANADIVTANLERIKEKHFQRNYTLQHPSEKFISRSSLIILISVGFITLIISCLNFINFMVFQSTKYLREICIRKVNGSGKSRLFLMLLKESLLLSLIPMLLSYLFFRIVSNGLYQQFGFTVNTIEINSSKFWLILFFILLGSALISTIYPMIRLTIAQPVQLLQTTRNNNKGFKKSAGLFTIIQLSLSVILISGIFLINRQITYINEQNIGFDKDKILVFAAPIAESNIAYLEKMDVFKNEAKKIPGVHALSASASIPGEKLITYDFGLKNKAESMNKYLGLSADEDFFETYGIKLLAGKSFSQNPELRNKEIIINKALCERLGFNSYDEAIGQEVNLKSGIIAGVVENYNHLSLHQETKPLLFEYNLNRLGYFSVNIGQKNRKENIAALKVLWDQTFMNSPFQYSYLSDRLNQQYINESRLVKITFLFTVVALIITFLGIIITSINLSGLRTKEIGIRKVNGARISQIVAMLNSDIIIWVAIAIVFATPVALLLMNNWLENFAYQTEIAWWIIPISSIGVLGLALFTVSIYNWLAATRNPVEALRYE